MSWTERVFASLNSIVKDFDGFVIVISFDSSTFSIYSAFPFNLSERAFNQIMYIYATRYLVKNVELSVQTSVN